MMMSSPETLTTSETAPRSVIPSGSPCRRSRTRRLSSTVMSIEGCEGSPGSRSPARRCRRPSPRRAGTEARATIPAATAPART